MYKNFAEKYFFAYRICIIYVFVCVYIWQEPIIVQ